MRKSETVFAAIGIIAVCSALIVFAIWSAHESTKKPDPPTTPSPPLAVEYRDVTEAEFLEMAAIAKRIQDFLQIAETTSTTAMIPKQPGANGRRQVMVISRNSFVTQAGNSTSSEAAKAWLILAAGAAGKYTLESPVPINDIAFADNASLRDYTYYVLEMSIAREVQSAMKADRMGIEEAYRRIKNGLRKTKLPPRS